MSTFPSVSAPEFSQPLMIGRKKLGGVLTLPPPNIFSTKTIMGYSVGENGLNPWETGLAHIHLEML